MPPATPPALGAFQGQRKLAPGTRVKIGEHLVTVQRFLSQGGFAYVYLVRADDLVTLPNGHKTHTLVLKHMCIWQKEALASVRLEVDYHRKLRGRTSIVHFVEASAATLEGDGWEIFLLMEWCPGGGLIDFLNTRLQKRLDEKEVLGIFYDVCRGVLVLHTMDPVMVHRDLKVENILMYQSSPPRFKLCDFGSCFEVRTPEPARTPEEKARIAAELNMHTTIWYRSPEMMDLDGGRPIDQRADMWALGVLLYKLCYYTTPFEAAPGGPDAIRTGRYTMPATPVYSPELRTLIGRCMTNSSESFERGAKRPPYDPRGTAAAAAAQSAAATPRAAGAAAH